VHMSTRWPVPGCKHAPRLSRKCSKPRAAGLSPYTEQVTCKARAGKCVAVPQLHNGHDVEPVRTRQRSSLFRQGKVFWQGSPFGADWKQRTCIVASDTTRITLSS
jgi:hypothetical protein